MITIFEIKKTCPKFFDRDTMKFFSSRIAGNGRVFEGPGGIYFITSEQFVPLVGSAHPRKYTVRQVNLEGQDIRSATEFNTIETYIEAERQAKILAKGYSTFQERTS